MKISKFNEINESLENIKKELELFQDDSYDDINILSDRLINLEKVVGKLIDYLQNNKPSSGSKKLYR